MPIVGRGHIPMTRRPVDEVRVEQVAEKLVSLYGREALDRAKELELTSQVQSFAKAVTAEVERLLKHS